MQKKTAKRYLSLILSMMVLVLTVFAWNTGTEGALHHQQRLGKMLAQQERYP